MEQDGEGEPRRRMEQKGEPDLLAQVEAIRAGFRRAGREMVLSGDQALLRGAFVLIGCALSWPLAAGPWWRLALLWTGVVLADAVCEILLYLRLARREPEKFVTGVERQFLKLYLLIAAVGGAFSAALVFHGKGTLVPAIWMLLIGAAYVTTGLFSFSRTWILGIVSCAAGAAALFLPADEPGLSYVLLATALGLGSLVWGVAVKLRGRRK